MTSEALDAEVDVALIEEVMRVLESEHDALPRHRHNLPREQVRNAQRARIIVATAEVVTEGGYASASTKAIISRAGVSSKTFYALYGGKDDAFFDAFTLLDGVVTNAVRTRPNSADSANDPWPGVRAFLATLAQWPLFTRMHAIEARAAGPRVLAHRNAVYGELADGLGAAIGAAQRADPRISRPSEDVLVAVIGGIGELVMRQIVERGVDSVPELEPSIVELIERASYPPPGN